MADRTVVLSQNGRHAVRGLSVNNPSEFSAYQDDDDDLTYVVDLSAYLDGATITVVTRVPQGVFISNSSNTTTRLTQRLRGFGYVDFKVQTSAGDVEEFRINILRRTGSKVVLGASGGGGTGVTPGDYGDISISAGNVWTIDNSAVTNAKVTSTFADGIESSKLRFTQAGTGAVARSVDAKLKEFVSVTDFGAKGDCQTFTGAASITSGQATLTVTGANFTSADVGKRVFVSGAGSASAPLLTTISVVTNSTTVTVTNTAGTTVSNVTCIVGTNDTTAIQSAITAASASGAPLFLPQGVYGVSSLTCTGGLRLHGPGTIAFDASAGAGLTVEPTRSVSTTVSAISNVQFPASTGIESGAGQLTVASSANFRRGDICHLRSTDDAPGVAAANAAELVQVSEVTNGTTIVLTAPVVGSYTTSVALEKLNAAPVEIDGPSFTFFGDPSALTAEPTRFCAVLLIGCVYPKVFATFKDDVCAGLVVLSCWRPNVDMSAVNLRTSSSVQYYGYGVGAYGATRGGTFNIRADRVRHAYTDGVWSTGAGDIRWGTALDNVVSGLATNCQMASWDTHPGAINTVFQNCGVYDSTTNNDQTSKDTVAAFQDRGLNTRFVNCWSIGSRRPFFLTAGRETYGVENTTTILGGYFERRGTSNGYLCFPDKTGSDTYKAEFHLCKIVKFEPAQQASGYNILSFFGCDFLQDGTAGINAANDFGGMIFRDCTFREFGIMRLGQSNNHVFQNCKRINSGSSIEPMIVGVGSTVDVQDYYAEAASYGNSSIIRAGAASDAGTVTINLGRLSAKNYTHASHLSTNGVCTLVTNTNANFMAFADGSATAPSITNSGDENTGLFFPAADTVAISTGGTQRLTVDSSGRVGINISSPSDALALYGASNALVNIRGDDTTGFSARRYNDTGTGSQNNLLRARGSFASPTAVANSDTCGIFTFGAYDGGDFRTVATLQGSVVTYTGSNDVSGRLSFWTRPSGSGASVAERMRLDHNGAVTVFGVQTVRVDNTTNNGVTTAAILSHTTSGTPANGIGTALDFEAETSNSNNEIGARISAVTTDVTAASEDFDLVFSTMAAGAAVSERARMKSTGQFRFIPLAADPAGAEDGDVYYNSTTNKLRVRANGSWVDLH